MSNPLAEQLGSVLKEAGHVLVTAESCTGGWVAKQVTDIAGSSSWFDRGFVTYTNEAKQEMLGVDARIIEQYGAVSLQTVAAMAEGSLHYSSATVSIAISGVAGPAGGSPEKPVGTVCFGWAFHAKSVFTQQQYFTGDREDVRRQSVDYALQYLLHLLE